MLLSADEIFGFFKNINKVSANPIDKETTKIGMINEKREGLC